MALKFIHISDSHLGFSDLDITGNDGRNIREEDVYKAFSGAVDIIIKENPDFVLHTGDIFHRSSPTNRAIVIAAREIQRIANAGIPFYMIAGNHDYPKSVFTSPIHEIYRINDSVNIAYSEKLEIFEEDNFILHLLPHVNDEEKFLQEVEKIKITDKTKPNILAMHIAVSSYAMNEYGERVFPIEKTPMLKKFDYVALGHWHKFNHLKKYGNVYYAGSTERTSESQTGYDKGIVKVTVSGKTTVEFIPLKLRRYEKIVVDNCKGKSFNEIISEIKKQLNKDKIEGGIFRIKLNDLPIEKASEFSRAVFEDLLEDALHFNVEKNIYGVQQTIEIDSESFDLKNFILDELAAEFKGKDFLKVKNLTEKLWYEIEEEEAYADQ